MESSTDKQLILETIKYSMWKPTERKAYLTFTYNM